MKLLGEPPLNSFLFIKRLLRGYKKEHSFPNGRCPISPNLLLRSCVVCYQSCFLDFKATLFAFAFSLMFFGALTGEMVMGYIQVSMFCMVYN